MPPGDPTDNLFFTGSPDDQSRSYSVCQFTYSTNPATNNNFITPFDSSKAYAAIGTTDAQPNYLNASVTPIIPSPRTLFSNMSEQEPYTSDTELTHYTTYGYMSPMDFNAPSPYDQSNRHVSCATQRPAGSLETHVSDRIYRLLRSRYFWIIQTPISRPNRNILSCIGRCPIRPG